MSKEDVNIYVGTPGADQSKQNLDSVGQSARKMGQDVSGSGKGAADATKEHESSLQKLALRYIGIQKVIQLATQAIREQIEAMKEHAEIAQRQQQALLRLQFLGDFFTEQPQARKEVAAMAEFGRRPFEEVAGAWYNLKSKAGAMTPQQRQAILKEALETGRTDPSMPLDTLVDMFSLFAKQTGETDANRIQNILQQTITEAGGGGADVAKYMPQFLPVGMAGGLSGAESAGLWAYVTTQLSEPSIATTGLKATFMGLQGKGSPESQKVLAKFGITPQMSFSEKIQRLSAARASGGLGLGEAEQLAGREGAAVLLSMLKAPGEMQRTMGLVVGADRGDIDITRQKIEQIFGADEIAKTEEDIRLLDVTIENQKAASGRPMKGEQVVKETEMINRSKGTPEAAIKFASYAQRLLMSLGLSSEALMPQEGRERFIKEGVLPADVGGMTTTVVNDNSNNINYQRPQQLGSSPRSLP